MCIVRKGHPVLFTSWKEIIPTKVLRTTGMEEADDSPLPPNFSQPTGKSYWWQSSGWVSGWNNSWLERDKLCLKSQGAVLTSWKPFQTALVWKDQLWYQKPVRKGSEDHNKPPKSQPCARGFAQVLLHPSEILLRKFCVHTGQIRVFSAVLHSHLLIWVLIPSCACHFNQLWPLPCKKTKVQTLLGFIFPLICVFCGGSVWELNCRLLCVKDESSSFWRDAPGLVSPENLKAPFPRKGPCLLSWGRVKEQKHEISFLLPWSIWPSLWEKLSDSSSLSCNVNTIKSTLAREAVYN